MSVRHVERETTESVYVFSTEKHACKVGVAGNVARRLKQIQVHCPVDLFLYYEIRLPNPRAVERGAHQLLQHARLWGEWFLCDPEECKKAVVEATAQLTKTYRTREECSERD